MIQLLKQVLLVCACLFVLTGQAIASSLSDALSAYKAEDYAKAVKLFMPLAQQGDANAQFLLGLMYADGHGISYDDRDGVKWWQWADKEAVKWFRLAAEKSNAPAQAHLGSMYYFGRGVTVDYKEAVKWYRLAAKQGDATAQFMLGSMYDSGSGVPQDYVLSYMWHNVAAANAAAGEFHQAVTAQRDSIAKKMTAQQIAEAQQLARKCTANKFKGC